MTALPWYVISNDIGTILAVYGNALGDEAREKAKDIAAQHGPVFLHHVLANRPHVGGSISMTGTIEPFYG